MDAQQIYDNFQTGVGGNGLSQAAAVVKELVAAYEERADSITQLTGRMESAWQGDAAGAAQRGAGPLAVEHALAAPDMNVAQDLSNRQVGSFDQARTAVTPVPPMPDKPSAWENVTSLGDADRTYEGKLGEHNAAAENNVSVMRSYADASDHNAGGMPSSYGTLLVDESGVSVAQPPGDRAGGFLDGRERADDTPDGREGGRVDRVDTSTGTVTPSTTQPPASTSSASWAPPGSSAPQTGGPGSLITKPGLGMISVPGPGPVPVAGFPPGSVPGPGQQRGEGGRTGGPGSRGGLGGGGERDARGGAGKPDTRGGTSGGRPDARGGGPGTAMGDGVRGAGPRAGGSAPGEHTARGASGARSGAAGAGMGAGGGRGQGGEDTEHERALFLQEHDPDALFGTDEITAPPVIGQ